MTRFPITTLAAVALATCASFARAQEEGRLVPCEPSRHEGAVPIAWGEPEARFDSFALPDDVYTSPEDYEIPLCDLLTPEIRAADGDAIPVDGGLRVEGDAAFEIAERRVRDIGRFVQGRGVFRVAVVHVPGPHRVSDAAGLRAAVANGDAEVLWSSRLALLRGEAAVAGETDAVSFVSAIDVEVAEYASIADPQTAELDTGVRVGLWQRPIDADRTRAFLTLQLSHLDAMESVDVASGTLDLPRVSFAAVGAPLLLERGAPALLTFDHPWESGSVAVLVEVLELPAAAEDLPFRLVDVAAIAGVDVTAPFLPLGLDDGSRWDEEEPGDPYDPARALADALLEANEGASQLTSSIVVLPLDADVPSVARVTALHRRAWSLPAADLAALPGYDALDGSVAREEGLAVLEQRLPLRDVRIPVAEGTASWYVGGTWTLVPSEVEVEIANNAVATSPVVHPFVDGDAFTARGARAGAVRVSWESVRTLARSSRALVVRKELDGKRVDEREDLHVGIRHRRARGAEVAEGAGRLTVRRIEDGAEVSVWDTE